MVTTTPEQIDYMKDLAALAAEHAFIEGTAGEVYMDAAEDGTPWAVVEGEFPLRRGHGSVNVGFRRGVLELDVRGKNRSGHFEQFPANTVSPKQFREVVRESVRYVWSPNCW